jgi:hypothetical protein
MNERRELRRRRLVRSIEVYDLATERVLGKGLDITVGGMLLITPIPVPSDSELELRLTLPAPMFGREYLELAAKAVWRKRDADAGMFDIGLEFTRVSTRDKEIIRQMMSVYSQVE